MATLSRTNPVSPTCQTLRHRHLKLWFIAGVLGVILAGAAVVLQPDPALAQIGPSGVACNASGGSGGLAPGEHSVTIGGRPALVYVGAGYNSTQPAILTFYLHGDGAGDQDSMVTERRQLLDDNGWIYVAPRAQGDIWYSTGVSSTPSGNDGIEANAQLLEDVFDALFADYNLCRNVLLGSSVSGGSWFYDGYFLPTRGDQYPAYMNVGCGSSGIDDGWSGFPFYPNLLTFNTNPDILARTKLHYSIGTADFLYPQAQQAIPHLQSLGFDVTTDFRSDVGHCAYDVDQTAVNWWTDLCRDGFIPVTSMGATGAVRPESCNAGQLYVQSCHGRPVTIDMNTGASGTGTAGPDVILGTPGADLIQALGGSDAICAGGGSDTVFGGDGNDVIDGGAGDFRDFLHGGPGGDTMFGGSGIDYIWGDAGADTIDGDGGSDRLFGGPGNDLMLGDSGADRMYGGPGDDEMRGMGGQDFMWGEAGSDLMQGNFQTDNMWGGPGDDTMFGAGGKDSLFGQAGNDALSGGNNTDYLNGGTDVDTANGGRGRDKPLTAPSIRASNGQFYDGSGCIAETIVNC